ncbi:MAG: 1-acyl-sn-glycerol-3-phosphate acyltransferase [Flavobacterium sp.]|nr:1-acyl-sn-glycerol-3-phosphate acyltransferase [Flavobacterium sp.]
MKKTLYKFIFCKIMGWKIVGNIDETVKKSVLVVIPHTSNLDFFIGIFSRGILQTEINFVAKKELFVFPFGYYFKSVGGEPLDRSGGKNLVDSIVSIFDKKETFRLAISPEGTRKKVTQLKTGFYYIALKAKVPIIPVAFDYGKKEVNFGIPLYLSGNFNDDMKILMQHFKNVKGKNPEYGFNAN